MIHAVGLDIRMIRHTGIGTYIRGLLESWVREKMAPDLDMALFGKNSEFEKYPGLARYPFFSGIYSVQEQLEYPLRIRKCRLWHAPHYNVPLSKGKAKLVVTIHDLIHWVFRKEFFNPLQTGYAETMLRRAVRQADHIIAVSEKTRDDLINHFNAEPDRISVIYEGVSGSFRETENQEAVAKALEKYKIPRAYFLYVGSLKPHKNVLWLIHLFRKMKQEGKIDASLVVVGRKDKRYPAGYGELGRLKNEKDIYHIPFLEEEDLVAFYNGALALIHPSLYEGFGLTLLEAMACGTPVIACRSASIPEVAGESACLVEPCNDRDMMDAIVRIEKFSNVREDLIKKGRLRSKIFQWDHAASKTMDIYKKVLEQ